MIVRVDPSKIRVPLPSVQQASDFDCGVAVLLSIFAYYGVKNVSRDRLQKRLRTCPKNGTRPELLVKAAKGYQLQTRMVCPMSDECLVEQLEHRRPVILSVRAYSDGHYVAAIGFDRRRVFCHDPMSDGHVMYLDRSELASRWWDIEDGQRVERLGIVVYRRSPPYTRRAIRIPD